MNRDPQYAAMLGFLGFWSWDADTGIIHASGALNSLFGICVTDGQNLAGMGDYEAKIHPEDVDWLRRERPRCFGPSGWGVIEYRVIDEFGVTHWVACRSRYQTNQDGEITSARGMMFDVTDFVEDGNTVRTAPAALPNPIQQTADGLIRAHEAAIQAGDEVIVSQIEAALASVGRLLASTFVRETGPPVH